MALFQKVMFLTYLLSYLYINFRNVKVPSKGFVAISKRGSAGAVQEVVKLR